jgi:hypothetical protein
MASRDGGPMFSARPDSPVVLRMLYAVNATTTRQVAKASHFS